MREYKKQIKRITVMEKTGKRAEERRGEETTINSMIRDEIKIQLQETKGDKTT